MALARCKVTVLFGAWIRGALRNLGRAEVRRQVGRRGRQSDGNFVLHRIEEARTSRRSRYVAFAATAHASLTPYQVQALAIHLQGMSATTVGARLGIGREAARQRIAGAWKQLERAARGVMAVTRQVLPAVTGEVAALLSPRMRRADALRAQGRTASQIADELECSREAAHSLLQRLRRQTRQALPRKSGIGTAPLAVPGPPEISSQISRR
jgi:DNA-binding CsgD family transcriptional regulator